MLPDKYVSDFRNEVCIDPREDYAVNYWSEKLNVSPQRILAAIHETGSNKLLAVSSFLKKQTGLVFSRWYER